MSRAKLLHCCAAAASTQIQILMGVIRSREHEAAVMLDTNYISDMMILFLNGDFIMQRIQKVRKVKHFEEQQWKESGGGGGLSRSPPVMEEEDSGVS